VKIKKTNNDLEQNDNLLNNMIKNKQYLSYCYILTGIVITVTGIAMVNIFI